MVYSEKLQSKSNFIWKLIIAALKYYISKQCESAVIFTKVNVIMFNLLKPTGYVMHQQFNIQQLFVLPTLYLCVLYLSENKERLVPLTA